MKKHWLRGMMLGVSVALLLAGGVALAQEPVLDVGCGTADIDGVVSPSEWANAAMVPLFMDISEDGAEDEAAFGGVSPSQDGEWVRVGTAYFMHDGPYFYTGATLGLVEDGEYGVLYYSFAFEDEPAGDPDAWVDCEWNGDDCDTSDEGQFTAYWRWEPEEMFELFFTPWRATHYGCWDDDVWADGVIYEGAIHDSVAHQEMRIDLEESALNNVGPGACFDLRWMEVSAWDDEVDEIIGYWPTENVDWDPYEGECTILCLRPCEPPPVEEFVPEPGTIMLLGSGLMGLAGYATLRWRTRE